MSDPKPAAGSRCPPCTTRRVPGLGMNHSSVALTKLLDPFLKKPLGHLAVLIGWEQEGPHNASMAELRDPKLCRGCGTQEQNPTEIGIGIGTHSAAKAIRSSPVPWPQEGFRTFCCREGKK